MSEEVAITGQKPKQRPLTIFAGGVLLILYTALCLFTGQIINSQIINKDRTIPTITPTVVTTPQIMAHQPKEKWKVSYENFSSDAHEWHLLYNQAGKLELIDGKLILQSYFGEGFGLATPYQDYAPKTNKYYVQADFTTDLPQQSYGLIFRLDRSLGTFYAFEIVPHYNHVRLLKRTALQWNELVFIPDIQVKPYPEENTLSVYFNVGDIELYVNGAMAGKYTDENPLQSLNIGAFVNGNETRLIVDNFFFFEEDE
jgi:hypothetical protein